MSKPSRVRIGKITGFHGLRGDVKIMASSPNPDWLGTLKHIVAQGPDKTEKPLVIKQAKIQGKAVLLQFEGYPDRTAVEPLQGYLLFAEKNDLPEPDTENMEFWMDDLLGLPVFDADAPDTMLGKVHGLVSSGSQDYLEIELTGTKEVVVLPLTERFFPDISVDKQQVLVRGLAGWGG